MKSDNKKIFIIPCSGIGKAFGGIGREAAFLVLNRLAKDKTETECLPLIVKGKNEVIEKLKDNKIITIDGCYSKCAYKDTKKATGKVDATFMTTDIVKENRGLKPERTIYPIGENAKRLAEKLAEKVAKKVDELYHNNNEYDGEEE